MGADVDCYKRDLGDARDRIADAEKALADAEGRLQDAHSELDRVEAHLVARDDRIDELVREVDSLRAGVNEALELLAESGEM